MDESVVRYVHNSGCSDDLPLTAIPHNPNRAILPVLDELAAVSMTLQPETSSDNIGIKLEPKDADDADQFSQYLEKIKDGCRVKIGNESTGMQIQSDCSSAMNQTAQQTTVIIVKVIDNQNSGAADIGGHESTETISHLDASNCISKQTPLEANVKTKNNSECRIDLMTSEDRGKMVKVEVDDVRAKTEVIGDDIPRPETNSRMADSSENSKFCAWNF